MSKQKWLVAKIIAILTFLFFFPILPPLSADMIHLKNGNSLEGIIEKEDKKSLTLDLGNGRISLNKNEISSIQRYTQQKQSDLRNSWRKRFFLRAEFVPEKLKGVALDFSRLQDLRVVAIDEKAQRQAKEREKEKYEKDIERSKKELAFLNTQIAAFNPESDPKKYNSLIVQSNSLGAKLSSDSYYKIQVEKEIEALDKNIASYINELGIFTKEFKRRHEGSTDESRWPEEQFFFDGVEKELSKLNSDFTQHKASYRMSGSSIVVHSLLNNLIEADLILDTGASLVTISQDIALKLGLKLSNERPSLSVMLADGREVKAFPVIIERLKVGEAEAKNVPAAVLENQFPGRENGLLGMSFLENFIVRLDPKGRQLLLEEFTPN